VNKAFKAPPRELRLEKIVNARPHSPGVM